MHLENHTCYYRIYIEDTDLMGIVYHSNYLNLFERARTEMLRDNGFSLTTMAIYDTHFAIRDIQVRYVLPARLDDHVMIKTTCQEKKACSLIFEQMMYNQHDQLLCTASVHVVCVDKRLKPKRLSEIKIFE